MSGGEKGDCGYWKGILGTGRGLWVLEGSGFGSRWVDFGYGARQLVAEQPRLGGKKGIVGTGRGLWVKRGTKRRGLGSWKGIVGKKGDKKEGFGVLEGDCG